MNRFYKTTVNLTILCFALLILLPANSITAQAEEGCIRISLKDQTDSNRAVSGVAFELFQVGTMEDNLEEPEFYELYEIAHYPQTAEELHEAAEIILERNNLGPLRTGMTNGNGVLEFNSLERGLYFVTADTENKYGVIMPCIVPLPYYESADGQLTGPGYQIDVVPKSEPYDKEPDGGKDPGGGEDPGGAEPGDEDPGDTEKNGQNNNGKNTGDGSGNGTGKKPVKTGDTSRTGLYLCMVLSSLFLIMGIARKRRFQTR